MNQPGFNGMIEGWLKNIAQLSQLYYVILYIYIILQVIYSKSL